MYVNTDEFTSGGEWKNVCAEARPASSDCHRSGLFLVSSTELQVYRGFIPPLCRYLERNAPKLTRSGVRVFAVRVAWSWRLPRLGLCRKTLVMEDDILARVSFESGTRHERLKFASKRILENIVPTFLPAACAFNASRASTSVTSAIRVGRQIFSMYLWENREEEGTLRNGVPFPAFSLRVHNVWRIFSRI